jgi:predicted nucleotidyltransferase
MSVSLSAEQIMAYRAGAQQRARQRDQALAARLARAWRIARQCAQLLSEHFGATQVVAFGSLVRPGKFHAHSDIDLAVWGLNERLYYRAVSRLLDIDPTFSIDLVEVEFAAPCLRQTIEQEGVLL